MKIENSAVYVFDTHIEAEGAIRQLSKAGFDMKTLSLIGKGYHSEEHPIGFYTVGDRIKLWGGMGAFWGGIWGVLLAPAVFFLPGLGLMAMAGPLASALVGALEGAALLGGATVLGAALMEMGMHKEQAIKYEKDLKADKFVLMVHGSHGQVATARSLLTEPAASESA